MVVPPFTPGDGPDRADDEVSHAECWAWRILVEHGEYTIADVTFMFGYDERTVGDHVNERCRHSLGESGHSRRKYSTDDLLVAFRLIHEKQPYRSMSPQVYEQHRPDHFPAAATIQGRFGSWVTARERALGDA